MINNTTDPLETNSTSTPYFHIDEDLKITQDVLVLTMILFIMVAMGADISWKQVWEHIRRPIGPIIGMFCQFVMMPFVGFIFNKIFRFESGIAVGLLIMSCCPGGAVSNAFAYYLDGDVPLSVTMTTISIILALGMMPFNIWIYTIKTHTKKLVIPYGNMALSLVIITSPVLVGMAIRWKYPKVATYVTKWCSGLGFILLLTVLILEFIYFKSALHQVSWKLIFTSIFMPITGILLGYFIAFLCRRSSSIRKTIATESGIQNAAVAYSIILLSFDIRKYITLLLIPWFYGTFQVVIFCILCLIYRISMRQKKKIVSDQEIEEENKDITCL